MRTESKTYQAQCKSCTLMLVKKAYQRAPWFKLFRTPLVWGMRVMAWWHGIDASRYPVNNPECYCCVRFMKNELKEKSPTFRWLNRLINPFFNRLRDAQVTAEDKIEAKAFAAEAMTQEQPAEMEVPS